MKLTPLGRFLYPKAKAVLGYRPPNEFESQFAEQALSSDDPSGPVDGVQSTNALIPSKTDPRKTLPAHF
ncbi:hypothetical protein [Variovorax sp. AFSI2.2]|uniref:hypothetical protein n=1 Tax=Variovorax sp. AFSI2.2 TaxID=3384160 RepID=UPI003EBD510B